MYHTSLVDSNRSIVFAMADESVHEIIANIKRGRRLDLFAASAETLAKVLDEDPSVYKPVMMFIASMQSSETLSDALLRIDIPCSKIHIDAIVLMTREMRMKWLTRFADDGMHDIIERLYKRLIISKNTEVAGDVIGFLVQRGYYMDPEAYAVSNDGSVDFYMSYKTVTAIMHSLRYSMDRLSEEKKEIIMDLKHAERINDTLIYNIPNWCAMAASSARPLNHQE